MQMSALVPKPEGGFFSYRSASCCVDKLAQSLTERPATSRAGAGGGAGGGGGGGAGCTGRTGIATGGVVDCARADGAMIKLATHTSRQSCRTILFPHLAKVFCASLPRASIARWPRHKNIMEVQVPRRWRPGAERIYSAATFAEWFGRPSRYFSASSAAMQPRPAAVTA